MANRLPLILLAKQPAFPPAGSLQRRRKLLPCIAALLISAIAVQRPLTTTSLLKMKELKNWQATEFGGDIIGILKSVG